MELDSRTGSPMDPRYMSDSDNATSPASSTYNIHQSGSSGSLGAAMEDIPGSMPNSRPRWPATQAIAISGAQTRPRAGSSSSLGGLPSSFAGSLTMSPAPVAGRYPGSTPAAAAAALSPATPGGLAQTNGSPTFTSIAALMRSHTCYELLPDSGKVVVFDSRLQVRQAFFALLEHEISCSPLWEAETGSFVGLMSASDFVEIIRQYHNERQLGRPTNPGDYEQLPIRRWREKRATRGKPSGLIGVSPEDSIFEACRKMTEASIHRICVVEQEAVLHIITHIRILRFIVRNLKGQSNSHLLDATIGDLQIGTFENVLMVKMHTPVIQVLNMLAEANLSSVPVLDDHDVVQNVYSKGDVAHLVSDSMSVNLNMTVRDAMALRPQVAFLFVGSDAKTRK
eukprot:TRINITY_DN4193_c0_g1_i2.p1 TRINITY_DN4193_c0_g1~~TRINITY_DN4193_c0_g1_i2.p1  ORF type:complete len:406 (+),score=77.49 TRINITY_DN4193_c0_g1_i2:32-1219(+)